MAGQPRTINCRGILYTINEDLDLAASRTLKELTGLKNIFLQQFAFFGKPDRISRQTDMDWLNETTGHQDPPGGHRSLLCPDQYHLKATVILP